jgi:uncharacterized protein YuzE
VILSVSSKEFNANARNSQGKAPRDFSSTAVDVVSLKEGRFLVSISGREDGTIEAVYISLSSKSVAKIEEIVDSTLLADYDGKGNLVEIEILAPVTMAELTQLVDQKKRPSFRRFIRQTAPGAFIHS